MALADASVGNLVRVLEAPDVAASIPGGYTMVVVSDHGFKAFENEIPLAELLRHSGLGDVCSVLPGGGSAMVYVKSNQRENLPRLIDFLRSLPGVESVADASAFHSLGLPLPSQNSQMADIVVYAKANYAFSGEAAPSSQHRHGTHGYAARDPDMDGIFIAAGYGIKHGAVLDRIENIDVAPTLARLLGLRLSGTSGRVLGEAIQK
jgi:predicted AlkP superfamily pyrophosphatase or phosphodiesterase